MLPVIRAGQRVANRNMLNKRVSIGIAGAGRVAQVLGRLLSRSGQPVVAIAGSLGPVEALTGPTARGDTTTVMAHLNALRNLSEPVNRLYGSAGRSRWLCCVAYRSRRRRRSRKS